MTRNEQDKLAAILRAERNRIRGLALITEHARISMYAAVTSIEYSIRDMLAAGNPYLSPEWFHDAARGSRRDSG